MVMSELICFFMAYMMEWQRDDGYRSQTSLAGNPENCLCPQRNLNEVKLMDFWVIL